MAGDPLESLLAQLCQGDVAAAERVFTEYEPYLRMVVRRMLPARLRSKFDSVDVVQSVWVDLVDGFRRSNWEFKNVAQLKAFLIKVTRNRFLDRQQRLRVPLQHEQSLEGLGLDVGFASKDDGSAENTAVAKELWDRMIALCPPQHQPLLELKRQGASLAEMAQHSGLHPSSIRRIFYELAARLAEDSAATDLSPEAESNLQEDGQSGAKSGSD